MKQSIDLYSVQTLSLCCNRQCGTCNYIANKTAAMAETRNGDSDLVLGV